MILISGDFTYQVEIKCWLCRRTALSGHRTTVQQTNVSILEEVLEKEFRNSRPNIPVGWSMNGRDRLYCEECT